MFSAYVPEDILIEISDISIQDTVVKRKALFTSLYHKDKSKEGPYVIISVLIQHFSNDGGNYGNPITDPGIKDYPLDLRADNLTIVDFTPDPELMGNILYTAKAGEGLAELLEKDKEYSQPTLLQGNFFVWLRDKMPVLIGGMIRKHILAKFS